MTFDELLELAKRRLAAGSAYPKVWADAELDLAACVPTAALALSYDVMRDSALRSWLQQDYSVPLDPGTGIGDLMAPVGSVTGLAGEVILAGIDSGTVLDFDGNILYPIPVRSDFFRPQPTAFGYYFVNSNGTILTRIKGQQVFKPADVQAAAGPLTITANYTPRLVADWPEQLQPMLVDKVVDIAVRKIESDANAS